MFEYLKMDMHSDGTEHCCAYENFNIDKSDIYIGTKYVLVNNYKKNSWHIDFFTNCNWQKIVAHGNDEILSLNEFKEWLIKNNIKDGYMNFLRVNKSYCKKYPNAIGVNFIISEE